MIFVIFLKMAKWLLGGHDNHLEYARHFTILTRTKLLFNMGKLFVSLLKLSQHAVYYEFLWSFWILAKNIEAISRFGSSLRCPSWANLVINFEIWKGFMVFFAIACSLFTFQRRFNSSGLGTEPRLKCFGLFKAYKTKKLLIYGRRNPLYDPNLFSPAHVETWTNGKKSTEL